MVSSIYQVFVKFFVSQLFGSYRQWTVFFLLGGFTVFGLLFYSYLNNFHSVFIQSLKKVYPETYINSYGKKISPPQEGLRHELEYFDISTHLVFRYQKDATYKKIIDLGLRSMPETQVEALFSGGDQSLDLTSTMWVNPSLLTFLSGSRDFDGKGIWVKSNRLRGEDVYLKIRVFKFQGLKDWAILPGMVMKPLGRPFNITTVYSDNVFDLPELKKIYRQHRMRIIEWTDRLPFFIKVVFLLSTRIYLILMGSFFFLVLFMATGILQDTLRELKIMIQFSSLYGARRYQIYAFAVCCILTYFGTIFLMGIIGAAGLSMALASAVPALSFMRALSNEVWAVFILIPVMCLMSSVYVLVVFNSKIRISE